MEAGQELSTTYLNSLIGKLPDTNGVSDGYHTFGELYSHRITLWVAFCRMMSISPHTQDDMPVWRSKLHSDGSGDEGWFVLGMFTQPGQQMTYHLPMSEWEKTWFADTLDRAPEFDGHTAEDVLARMALIL